MHGQGKPVHYVERKDCFKAKQNHSEMVSRGSIRRATEVKGSLLLHGGVGVWGTGTVGVGLAGVLNYLISSSTGSHVALRGGPG